MLTRSQADIQEIDRLKSLYRAAISRKFSAPGAQDSGPDTEDQKRTQKALKAIELENQAFVERLRRRLVELGVGKEDIQQAAISAAIVPHGARKKLAKARTAILVVHGIGEQNP